MALDGAPSTQPMFSPAVWQGSSSVLPPLHAHPLALALVALFSRSFGRWYRTHWRSFSALSAGSSPGGTSCTSAPRGAVEWANDIPALWQVVVGFPSIWVIFTSRLACLGWCSGTGVALALVRPVVPYTRALFGALSAGGVSSSGALQRSSWPTSCSPSSSSG